MILDFRSEPFKALTFKGTHVLVGSLPGAEGQILYKGADLKPIAKRARASTIKNLEELRFDIEDLPDDFIVQIRSQIVDDPTAHAGEPFSLARPWCRKVDVTLQHLSRTLEFEAWKDDSPELVFVFDARNFNGIPHVRRTAWEWLDSDPINSALGRSRT